MRKKNLFRQATRLSRAHITLIQLWKTPADFYTDMGISNPTDEQKSITEYLFYVEGQRGLKYNSLTRNKNNVYFQITEGAKILKDILNLFNKNKDKIIEQESKVFNVGDLQETSINDFSNYLTQRQTASNGAALDIAIQQRIAFGSKTQAVIDSIRGRIFYPIYIK